MSENGLEALHNYEQDGADLLIVNHAMPKLDGPALIRLLRARGDKVPIVGISGDCANREEELAAGATEFVETTDLIGELPALLARFKPG